MTNHSSSIHIVKAYRQTLESIRSEYPFRIVVSVLVGIVLTSEGLNPWLATCWLASMAALLHLEIVVMARFFAVKRDAMARSAQWKFAALSFVTAGTYAVPVWLMLPQSGPATIFALTAFMAGALINLTVHNANTPMIYLAATSPMMVTFLTTGAMISIRYNSWVSILTALAFTAALLQTYRVRSKYAQQIRKSIATAQREKAAAEREKAAAEEAANARAQFLAKMSHELRTPLNGVIGMAQVLRDSQLTEDQQERLDIIIGSSDTLLWLLNGILDHAKIEAEHLVLEESEDDLRDLVAQSTMLFQPEAIRKNVQLTYDTQDVAAPYVLVDGRRLRQCVNNLVSNAVKFTDSGEIKVTARIELIDDASASGIESLDPAASASTSPETTTLAANTPKAGGDDTIRPEDIEDLLERLRRQKALAASTLDGFGHGDVLKGDDAADLIGRRVRVSIEVADTGIGMSDEQAARVFEAFEQADNSITRRFGGTGLGLSVSRGIVHAMGGDIVLTSALGEGSTFTLQFETVATAAPVSEEIDLIAEPIATKGGRILLVEDNLVNRQVAKALLKAHEVEITEAENGQIALDLMSEKPFDLVFMDIHMPVMDGLTAMKEIRSADQPWAGIPIVALTAAVSAEDQALCREAGSDAIIGKPVKADELTKALEKYVWRRVESGSDVATKRSA